MSREAIKSSNGSNPPFIPPARKSAAGVIPFSLLVLLCGVCGQQCAPATRSSVELIPPPQLEPAPKVTLETTQGKIVLELFPQQAPKTVESFLQYVREGFYARTILHQAAGNMIVGGAYTRRLQAKPTREPVANESNNGLRNIRGRLGLYLSGDPESGTSQFFINVANNGDIDYDPQSGTKGMTVFGKVVEGMPVVDAISKLETRQDQASDGTTLDRLPVETVIIEHVFLNDEEMLPPEILNNQPPIASAGADKVVVPGLSARLDGSASSDPNIADTLEFTWEQTAGTPVAIDNANSDKAAFTVPEIPGTLTFKLTVKDLQDATSEASVSFTVVTTPKVRLKTSMGDVILEVLLSDMPITSRNFLQYVHIGFYNGTIFHRVIKDFVVQGGGFYPGMSRPEPGNPIDNEFGVRRPNLRGTVAPAKTSDPDSATSQFFINVKDNPSLDDPDNSGGFAVFAQVIEGMSVVDAISVVPTTTRSLNGVNYEDLPEEEVFLISATIE